MVHYEKCQAWSCTPDAHMTGFHDAALLAGTSYHLPSTPPFNHYFCSTFVSSTSNATGPLAPVLRTAVSDSGGGMATKNDLIQFSMSKATQVLCPFQAFTSAGTLGQALGLNL